MRNGLPSDCPPVFLGEWRKWENESQRKSTHKQPKIAVYGHKSWCGQQDWMALWCSHRPAGGQGQSTGLSHFNGFASTTDMKKPGYEIDKVKRFCDYAEYVLDLKEYRTEQLRQKNSSRRHLAGHRLSVHQGRRLAYTSGQYHRLAQRLLHPPRSAPHQSSCIPPHGGLCPPGKRNRYCHGIEAVRPCKHHHNRKFLFPHHRRK